MRPPSVDDARFMARAVTLARRALGRTSPNPPVGAVVVRGGRRGGERWTGPAGRIATASGESRWVSGAPARRFVHALRNHVDAVMVGAGTILADDPALTCRVRGGRDPLRVVIDGQLRVSPRARVIRQHSAAAT